MPAASAAVTESQSAAIDAARAWVTLVDQQRWQDCWDKAAHLFQSRISAAQFAAKVEPVRQPLGPVSDRTFRSVTEATSLPGVPVGQYAVIEFHTHFAHKPDAVETVTLAHEEAGWRVGGYFIR